MKTFFTEEISWKFPRKKYHEKSRSNFIRNFTYISLESITRSNLLQFFSIFSRQLSQKKNSPRTTLTEIHTIMPSSYISLLACPNETGDNRRSFVVEKGPPPICAEVQQQQRCVHAYLETGSARPTLSCAERFESE